MVKSKRDLDLDVRPLILFQNYDYSENIEPTDTSPGGGFYHGRMDKFKSVEDFLKKKRRKKRINSYHDILSKIANKNEIILYHQTSLKNIDKIKQDGFLTSSMYTSGWYTLTDSFEGALKYTRNVIDEEDVILEFHIPKQDMKEFLWPFPFDSKYYGNSYALRKPLPIKFLTKTHPVSYYDKND